MTDKLLGTTIRNVWKEIQDSAPPESAGSMAFFDWTHDLAARVKRGEVEAFDALQAMKWLMTDRAAEQAIKDAERHERILRCYTRGAGALSVQAHNARSESPARERRPRRSDPRAPLRSSERHRVRQLPVVPAALAQAARRGFVLSHQLCDFTICGVLLMKQDIFRVL